MTQCSAVARFSSACGLLQEWACAALANILSNCTLDNDERNLLALATRPEDGAEAAASDGTELPPAATPPADESGDDFSTVGAVRRRHGSGSPSSTAHVQVLLPPSSHLCSRRRRMVCR